MPLKLLEFQVELTAIFEEKEDTPLIGTYVIDGALFRSGKDPQKVIFSVLEEAISSFLKEITDANP